MGKYDGNSGISKLAGVIGRRIAEYGEGPLILDFGEILSNLSLKTNTFKIPLPKGSYSICRGAHQGNKDETLTITQTGETVLIPESMRGVKPGDRVLVAWVQSEAVVVDIVQKS
ncbi:MAG: hypothetical protein ACI4F1_04540 [Bariatricus sp.]